MDSARKSYSLKEKREVVRTIDTLVGHGNSRRKACAVMGILPLYYRRWKRVISKVDDLEAEDSFCSFKTNGTARKIHTGRVSLLAPVKEHLSVFVSHLREQGIQCTNRMVAREAARLVPSFEQKSTTAQVQIVRRFTKHLGLTQRMATHTAQKHFRETEESSRDFIAMMREKTVDRNKDDIINMDQTPIAYSYHSNKTLDTRGSRTVHVRASTTDTKRVTVAATVTASGKMLSPFMIFKGAPKGRIASREFGTYPATGKYACQRKAWMDEEQMHAWIDLVLTPYKKERDERDPDGPPPILILDAYRVHQMGSIVNRIQMMGIEVIHIPAGCTYLCQPIDVGINKPLKSLMRAKWEDWMTGEGVANGIAKEPSRQQVAEWLVDAYTHIPNQVARNAWMKQGYAWF